MLVVSDIRVPIGTEESELAEIISHQLKMDSSRIQSVRLLRKSLDARKKQDIHYQIQAAVSMDAALEKRLLQRGTPHISEYRPAAEQQIVPGTVEPRGRIVVVGLGPAGLFAAYTLAKHGYRPLVIERGQPIQQRVHDVDAFWNRGTLLQDSNVMFGEGG
ncbi:MAG: NAD(P)-binding protein, partial [Butyricicoccus sp.]